MLHTFFESASPPAKLIFALFIIVLSFLLSFVVALVLAIPLFDLDLLNLSHVFSDYTNPENLAVIKYFQIFQSLGLFVVPPLFIGMLYHKSTLDYLSLRQLPKLVSAIIVVAIMLAIIPVINILAEFNNQMQFPDFMSSIEQWMKESEQSAMQVTQAFLNTTSRSDLLLNIFMIAVIPAVGEELLFRGVLQKIFIQWTKNSHIGIFIAAFLFSAIHMQFYGFLPRFVLGLLFGYFLIWSSSIWLPILAHFINNSFAVMASYMIQKEQISEEVEKVGSTSGTYLYAIISLILVGSLIYLLFFKEK